jgi:RNA polymerase sigma factor (sigma-70 family)
VESWWVPLQEGDIDSAWDLFIDRYRRLIIATIRRTLDTREEIPDVFAHICHTLAADDLRVLRRYFESADDSRARFSTWLVVVVRNQTVDWMRMRSGRRRITVPPSLSPLQREIFQHVFAERRSHAEAFEVMRDGGADITFAAFLRELAETYRRVERSGGRGVLRHFPPAPSLDTQATPHPAAAVSIAEARSRLDAVLESLPADTRLAVELFVVDEMPAEQVAQTVGWQSAKDVYNRVYRALGRLRQALERQGMGRGDL